jgi:hypothetical protein
MLDEGRWRPRHILNFPTEIERNNPLDLRNPHSLTVQQMESGRRGQQLQALRNTAKQQRGATVFDILRKSQKNG